MPDHDEIGRPAVEAVFVAWALTAMAGLVVAHGVAALARAAASSPQGLGLAPQPGVPLTLCVVCVSLAFAVAQAALPGPKSTGCFGLLLPLAGATALAVRGLNPSAVVGAFVAGVFLTPAAYYLAVRLSFPLRGVVRRRPLVGLLGGATGVAAVVQVARWLTWIADPASHGRFW